MTPWTTISEPRALRTRWRTASLASGWRFPADWADPVVDRLCRALAADDDPAPLLAELGAARAAAGVGLAETLTDLAALRSALGTPVVREEPVAVDSDAMPGRYVRLIALGWADAALSQVGRTDAADPLTGLATTAYLRTRLREVYQQARSADGVPERRLVLITSGIRPEPRLQRIACMMVVADVLRSVFRSGETLAKLGTATAVVLAEGGPGLRQRADLAARLIDDRLRTDPSLAGAAPVEIRLHRLPVSHAEAGDLLVDLARR